jgi:hypothetical protein
MVAVGILGVAEERQIAAGRNLVRLQSAAGFFWIIASRSQQVKILGGVVKERSTLVGATLASPVAPRVDFRDLLADPAIDSMA